LLIPPDSNLIPEDQVSPQRLCNILDASSIKCTSEDQGEIYVMDGIAFPLWIVVHQDLKLILMFTYIESTVDETLEWLDKINTLNASIILPQFSYYEGWGRYWLPYEGGLSARHLVNIVRRFAGAFRAAVEDLEIYPPGSAAYSNPPNAAPRIKNAAAISLPQAPKASLGHF
jgi:hypothetical protein